MLVINAGGDEGNMNEVSVFFAPAQQKWVVRTFSYGLRCGDKLIDHEPSDTELARDYPGYLIRREWVIA